jgi:hypothetical protein
MARYSKAAQGMKIETGDIVVNQFDMKGKVLDVMVMRPDTISDEGVVVKPRVDVLLVVDFTRGTDAPSIVCLEEVTAVRVHVNEWVNLKGEETTV